MRIVRKINHESFQELQKQLGDLAPKPKLRYADLLSPKMLKAVKLLTKHEIKKLKRGSITRKLALKLGEKYYEQPNI